MNPEVVGEFVLPVSWRAVLCKGRGKEKVAAILRVNAGPLSWLVKGT